MCNDYVKLLIEHTTSASQCKLLGVCKTDQGHMTSNYGLEEKVIKLMSRNFLGIFVLLFFLSIFLKSSLLSNLLYVLFGIYIIIPGLVIWTKPKFALAWFNGLNHFVLPDSWEKLGNIGKVILYTNSILGLIFGILMFLWLIFKW